MAEETYAPSETTSTRTGWTGWITFAAIMMIISGGLNAFYGLVGIVNDEWAVWTNNTVLLIDISVWGWIHLLLGLLVLLSGIGLFSGSTIARTVGVIAVSLAAIGNFFFMPAYPFWTIVVIAIDVLVIWALTVHGAEMRAD